MERPEIWKDYYAKTSGRPPRPTLLRALELFEQAGLPSDPFAVDLGSGGGRDTVPLLRRGWRVMAIDREQSAIDSLLAREDIKDSWRARLDTRVAPFEGLTIPACHLVNAGFSLQGCDRTAFPDLWHQVEHALAGGGRFAGQLLGPNDSWAQPGRLKPGMTYFSRPEVEKLLARFDVEWLEEVEEDSVTPRGEAKHWHFFHIVALRA